MSLIISGVDASTNYNMPKDSPNSNLGYMSYQINFTGLDATDGVVNCQYSNDGVNWDAIPGLTETVTSANESVHFNINAINHAFYRITWAAGSNTAGTFAIYVSS